MAFRAHVSKRFSFQGPIAGHNNIITVDRKKRKEMTGVWGIEMSANLKTGFKQESTGKEHFK